MKNINREIIVIIDCLPQQQHHQSPSRIQKLVLVVTNDPTETGNDGAVVGGLHTAAA